MKQISIVFEVFENEELGFLEKIYEFTRELRESKNLAHPKITGVHTKLIEEDRFK